MFIGHAYIFFGEMSWFKSYAHLLIFFLIVELQKFLMLYINSLSDIWFTMIFFHPIGCLFTWLFPFRHRTFKVWCSSICLFFTLLPVLLALDARNHCSIQCTKDFLLFSCRNLIVSSLMVESKIIFVSRIR